MSIIYEALKKVEKTQQDNANPSLNTEKKPKKPAVNNFLVYALVAVFGIFLANFIFGLIANKPAEPPVVAKKTITEQKTVPQAASPAPQISVPVAKETPAPIRNTSPAIATEKQEQPKPSPEKFVLNGLFFSDNLGYALVNNEIVKEGDSVGGAVVKRISLEGVELEVDGQIIKLNNSK